MTHEKKQDKQQQGADAGDAKGPGMKPVGMPKDTSQPKSESTPEYEGNKPDEPTGNPAVEVKTETSSSSGQ